MSARSCFTIVSCIFCVGSLLATPHDPPEGQTTKKPVKVADAEAHKPSPLPDRIILTWSDDPATSVAVTWRTDTSVTTAQAQLAEADAGPLFRQNAQTIEAKTEDFESKLGEAHMHSVEFKQLKPKTKYAYRVGDGVNWSEWFQFTTASATPEPFSFIYFGDAQNDVKSMWSRVVREAIKDAPKASFMLHAGDLINKAEDDAEWGEWHQAGGWLNGMVPSIVTPGNHEYSQRRLTKHWRAQFTLPKNGPETLHESTYYIDYQGTRIISLNSNEQIDLQSKWLDGILADNPCQWTVITFHHPIYSTAKSRDNPIIRAAWQPIFDKYRVDLVLSGHDHTYGRTGLEVHKNAAEGDVIQSTEAGTMYVVSVAGPKMYDLNKTALQMKRVAEDTQLYQIIHINGETLLYEARTAVGELYDAFTLQKRPGQINKLIDEMPNTPARLRIDRTKPSNAVKDTEKVVPVIKP